MAPGLAASLAAFIDRATGGIFLLFGLRLAFARR
jgi:threonine/homoserine/homoserine lactone efflux protein